MTSVICQNFAGNAWRKDLCSNCFKSRDEHGLSSADEVIPVEDPSCETSSPARNVPCSAKPTAAALPQRYSAGTIQPPWRTGLTFGPSSPTSNGNGDLRSPQLLKTAFMFNAGTKQVDNLRVGNPADAPAPLPSSERAGQPGSTPPKAIDPSSQPLSSSDESDSAVSSGSFGTPPPEVLPDSRSKQGNTPKFTARFVDPVQAKSPWNAPKIADLADETYRPRYSVSDFKEAYGAHAADVGSRVATLNRGSRVTSIAMSTPEVLTKRDESSSSLNSSLSTSDNASSAQRVIIHKITKSILKPRRREPKSKSNNVCFPSEEQSEVEVIGYGGDETYYSSDEEEEEDDHQQVPSDDDDDEDFDTLDADATPDERRLKNVTDRNTDYNGNPSNLLYGEVPDVNQVETINPLMTDVRRRSDDASVDTTFCSDVSLEISDSSDTKKETPKVSVKPFVQRQPSWQKYDAENKPSTGSTVSSWLYKQQQSTPASKVPDENDPPVHGSDSKSFLHSTKVPVQHVAPMVSKKPPDIDTSESTDLQAKFSQLQRSYNKPALTSPTSPKPPILKPKPKISPKPSTNVVKTSELSTAMSHERFHDVINEEQEDKVVKSRHAQSMHDLLSAAEVDVDSSFESTSAMPTVSKSHDNLGTVDADLPGRISSSNKTWESQQAADVHGQSTPGEPKNLPIISESSPIVIRVNATPAAVSNGEKTPAGKPPAEPSKFKKFAQSLHRSNSDLSSNVRVSREAEMNLKNVLGSVFSPKQHSSNKNTNSSTKRQAPQPPQRGQESSPTPILKNYSKNGSQAAPKQQMGNVERRSRDKKSATLSPGTNGASVQFLLNPTGEFADFRESSPSPTTKRKQRRSRSLPRPADLFLTSETSAMSSSKRKGCFSPQQESEKLGKSLSVNEDSRGRSTAKKKTKNFIMKLLKRGSSSTTTQGSNGVTNSTKSTPVEKEKTGKSAKYTFEPKKEERKSKLQIVHPLDMRKKAEFGDDIIMGNGDYVMDHGTFKLDVSNNNDIVVNRVLPAEMDGKRNTFRKIGEDAGYYSPRDAMRLPGQTDVDLESTPVSIGGKNGGSGLPAGMKNGTLGVASAQHMHAPNGRPKPPPPPRSSSNKNRDVDDGTSYANLGGARQAIAPTKPERSNSIKDMSTPSNARCRSKRDSPGVDPPPPPVAPAVDADNKEGKERKASPYAITPCPNIDAPSTPPETPPGGYNVPRPSALSIAQHAALQQCQSSPVTRQPPSSNTGAAAAFIINQLRGNNNNINNYNHHNYHHDTSSSDDVFDDVSAGPSSLNIVIGAHNGGREQSPPLSTFCAPPLAPPPPAPTNNGNDKPQQQVLGSRSYASRLSLRGTASSRDSLNSPSHYAEANNKGGLVTSSGLGRSPLSTPVHKRSLEDNYGAVVAANHQALAQLLDQVQDRSAVPDYLKSLQERSDVRWADFQVHPDAPEIRVGKRLFVSAIGEDDIDVTLMLCGSDFRLATRGTGRSPSGRHLPFVLPSVRAFVDMLPTRYLLTSTGNADGTKQGSVCVLPKMSVTSVQDFRRLYGATENFEKAVAFLLLQMVSALKHLQAQGIEEMDATLDNFVITSYPDDPEFRLVLLCDDVVSLLGSLDTRGNESPTSSFGSFEDCRIDQGESKLSLCQSAITALLHLLGIAEDPVDVARNCRHFEVPGDKFDFAAVFSCVGEILGQERAGSLTQVKSLLEYVLWGPDGTEIDPGTQDPASAEKMIHQWLDLERAHVLNNLIRTQAAASKSSSLSSSCSSGENSPQNGGPGFPGRAGARQETGHWLTIFEEYQLMFLVRTSVKSLKDVMYLLASRKTLSEA